MADGPAAVAGPFPRLAFETIVLVADLRRPLVALTRPRRQGAVSVTVAVLLRLPLPTPSSVRPSEAPAAAANVVVWQKGCTRKSRLGPRTVCLTVLFGRPRPLPAGLLPRPFGPSQPVASRPVGLLFP